MLGRDLYLTFGLPFKCACIE